MIRVIPGDLNMAPNSKPSSGRSRRGVPFYIALLILIVGIAVAVFVILFFGAVLMLYGGA
jgi:hypothetical protein